MKYSGHIFIYSVNEVEYPSKKIVKKKLFVIALTEERDYCFDYFEEEIIYGYINPIPYHWHEFPWAFDKYELEVKLI